MDFAELAQIEYSLRENTNEMYVQWKYKKYIKMLI